MVCFLNLALFATNAPTLTWSAKICRYGMGSETPERSGAMVSQAHKSSHFRQEVVLSWVWYALTPSHCTC